MDSYLDRVLKDERRLHALALKKNPGLKTVRCFVASAPPAWQQRAAGAMRRTFVSFLPSFIFLPPQSSSSSRWLRTPMLILLPS